MSCCSVVSCEGKAVAKGLCGKHYQRMKKYGDPLKKISLKGDSVTDRFWTVDGQNQAQITILQQAGWNVLAEFDNRKTGGITQVWGCAVTKD